MVGSEIRRYEPEALQLFALIDMGYW